MVLFNEDNSIPVYWQTQVAEEEVGENTCGVKCVVSSIGETIIWL